MRSARPVMATLLACSLPLLAACGPAAGDATSAEASLSSAAAAMSSSASAAVSSASAAMSSASAAMSSSASAALASASRNAAATPAPTTTGTTGTRAVNFRMPDMRGQVLQDAQDALQAAGVFYSTSHDLRGVRHQVLDRDWKVCSQNVPAGQQVTGNAEGTIDFGVVKLSEACP
jgi:PASTA domain